MIQAVVFDFGGVLSLPQDSAFYTWAEAETGLPESAYRAGYVKYRPGFDGGIYEGQEMYRRILEDAGIAHTPALLDAINDHDLTSWARPQHETQDWALELQKLGLKVGILTNMPLTFLDYFTACAGRVRECADAEVISAAVNMIKPDAPIYLEMARRLGVPPQDVFFFDDLEVNVAGAKAAGMQGAIFSSVQQAKADLAIAFGVSV